MRQTCLKQVYELAKGDSRIFFVGSDLGFKTLSEFQEEMPDRFFVEGICEQASLGMAAGLAMEGKIVYYNTIAPFITRRAYEQVVVDICMHNANVRMIGNGGGLVYAPLGPTHLALEDIATMRLLPSMTILHPADAIEMARMMPATVNWNGPIYIRLARGHDPIVTEAWQDEPFEIGQAVKVRDGNNVLIIETGICIRPAVAASDILSSEGIQVEILHCPTIKPLDFESIKQSVDRIDTIVTIEEGFIAGGLGSSVAEWLVEAGYDQPKRFKRIGLPDEFPRKYGNQAQLMGHYNITGEGVASEIRALFAK